jgi:cytochrome c peroxidase
MIGAFKTPTLRGVSSSAPYGHGGAFPLLRDVTRHYGERAKDVPLAKASGVIEEWVPAFDELVQDQLPALLDVMTADVDP